ncbi:reverse transcriptase domain-containing protein [Raoultella ornithinolytica]|uniref:reverse transcriptase domain-containing protein n=1 Tax=Raoultella ornithinolytica TaxID=54291 RepID=UPI0021B03EAB|nr:reverse transcriptase domain-containing protein [Raoultella ornithinolytica]MCT4737217.1 hypothetical protein [Raoultella ornithinolytica]
MNRLTKHLQDGAADGAYARMEEAWQWLCAQRTTSPDDVDVWDIRHQAVADPAWLTDLTHRVLCGEYRLTPLLLSGKQENRKAVWGAQDALVLKWTALSIQHLLPLHKFCEHVKGHGCGKQSVHKLHHLLTQPVSGSLTACRDNNNYDDVEKETAESAAKPDDAGYRTDTRSYKWVCRTDIRGYYRNINKATLIRQVRQRVQSPVLTDLVNQYIHYTVEDGGTFHTPEKGISRGCPLSSLMGALHLYEMDAHFARQKHIHYARYMDDIIILAKSRWSLRRHTKRLKQWFSAEGFEAHPDKTQIGRIEKGFDWMGAWLTHEGVTDIAPRAKANHREKVRRLYERLARVPLWRRKRARQQVNARVSTYRWRWKIWAGALLIVTGAARADGPVVVLTSGNVPGDTGARFDLGTVTLRGPLADSAYSPAWGFGSITNHRISCAGLNTNVNGTIATPNLGGAFKGWAGFKVAAIPNLALVAYGSGTAIRGNERFGWLYDPTSDGGIRSTYGNVGNPNGNSILCPNRTGSQPWVASGERESTITATLHAISLGALTSGVTKITELWAGDFSRVAEGDLTSPFPKPTNVIVSGLNCALQVTSVSGASATGVGTGDVTVDLGTILRGDPIAGTSDATAVLALTTNCSGTNSTDPAAHGSIWTTITAGAGTMADAAGFLRAASGSGGHYLTLNPNNPSCNVSKAVTDGLSKTTYTPGDTGKVKTETVVASLCSDGSTPTLGPYTIRAVAALVSQ